MELDSSLQIPSESLQKQHFDVIIAASGYESRCTFLSEKIDVSRISARIVLAFNEKAHILARPNNDDYFTGWNFTFYSVSPYDVTPLKDILDRACIFQPRDSLKILVDYSGMPKVWYKAIIYYFLELEERLNHASIWFSYTPSAYTKSHSNTGRKQFSQDPPVIRSERPVTLVLGLGDEKGRAEELLQRIHAETTLVFYADPAVDDRFVRDVLENNRDLLKQVASQHLIKYPIQNLNSINKSLTDVCFNFRMEKQLVLAPVGPKPFTLMCYVLAARYPDIKIWEVKSFGDLKPSEKKAQGDLLVYALEFTAEEVDYSD